MLVVMCGLESQSLSTFRDGTAGLPCQRFWYNVATRSREFGRGRKGSTHVAHSLSASSTCCLAGDQGVLAILRSCPHYYGCWSLCACHDASIKFGPWFDQTVIMDRSPNLDASRICFAPVSLYYFPSDSKSYMQVILEFILMIIVCFVILHSLRSKL
jgi:hypothetical protein